jgi:hypothetical protein
VSVIKLTTSELEQIQIIQQRIAQITIDVGKTSLAIYETENDLKRLKELYNNLINSFEETIKQETELSSALSKIYGSGFVDVPNGTFVKDNEVVNNNNRTLNETVVSN